MFGHPSEALFWAPDSRDDLAFTMYATEREEINNAKDQIVAGLISGEISPQSTFLLFMDVMSEVFPMSKNFTDEDWDDIRAVW